MEEEQRELDEFMSSFYKHKYGEEDNRYAYWHDLAVANNLAIEELIEGSKIECQPEEDYVYFL